MTDRLNRNEALEAAAKVADVLADEYPHEPRFPTGVSAGPDFDVLVANLPERHTNSVVLNLRRAAYRIRRLKA